MNDDEKSFNLTFFTLLHVGAQQEHQALMINESDIAYSFNLRSLKTRIKNRKSLKLDITEELLAQDALIQSQMRKGTEPPEMPSQNA